jgi:hypothetical protein
MIKLCFLPWCVAMAAADRSTVPLCVWTTDGLLVPSELSYHCSHGGGSADARAVPAGDAGVHLRTVRLPARILGVSTAFTPLDHRKPLQGDACDKCKYCRYSYMHRFCCNSMPLISSGTNKQTNSVALSPRANYTD